MNCAAQRKVDSMAREYVPIFFDWLEVTQDLTAEEKGNLIDAVLFAYEYRQEVTDVSRFHLSEKAWRVFVDLCGKINEYFNLENGRPAGEFHWNWKGGKTPENQKERSSKEYREWRGAVFERDNFTCQICGQVGGELNAHHIKRWSTNVDERYQIDNGVTLCKKCHDSLHRKGG
jgi:hypothetical protein